MMDPDQIARQLLRHLRGSRSQVAFSRRLGFKSNVAHTWETGKRMPTAAVTFAAAQRVGVDVSANFRRFTKVEPTFLATHDIATPAGVAAMLRELRRDIPIQELAARTGRSRFQISRWLAGTAEPRLPDLLRLVEGATSRWLDFVAVLVDPAQLPDAAESWRTLEAARSLFWHYPRAQLVLLALDLQAYRELAAHDDLWLARRLGLELFEVTGDLERLAATGQIAWHDQHWTIADVQTVDTRRYPEAGTALKRWWTGVAASRMEAPEASMSYNVFTVSQADYERIVELHRSTFAQLRTIVSDSQPGERLVLVQHHILPLDNVSTNSHPSGHIGPTILTEPT